MTGDEAKPADRPRVGEIADFAEAVVALMLASLAIAVLPFRRLMRTIANPRGAVSVDIDRSLQAVIQAIGRAERRLPLRIVCLHKALATHWMLRRRGVTTSVHYGVSPADSLLKAHVWVDVGSKTIMGEDESNGFARVATFPDAGEQGTPAIKR